MSTDQHATYNQPLAPTQNGDTRFEQARPIRPRGITDSRRSHLPLVDIAVHLPHPPSPDRRAASSRVLRPHRSATSPAPLAARQITQETA